MGTEQELDTALENAGLGSEEGDNAGSASPSEASQDQPQGAGDQPQTGGDTPSDNKPELSGFDEQTLADLREGRLIPKYRFDQLNEKLRAYEGLGDSATVAQAVASFKAQQAGQQNQQLDPNNPNLTNEDKQVLEYMRRLFPGLNKLQDIEGFINSQKQFEEARREAYLETARSNLAEMAGKDLNIKTKEQIAFLEEMVNAAIAQNPIEHQKFVQGDIKAVDRAFQVVKKMFVDPLKTSAVASYSQTKGKQNSLPRTPGRGGIPGAPQPSQQQQNKEASFEQLHDKAWERLHELSSAGA